MFHTVLIWGTGLMGSAFGSALITAGLAKEVYGVDALPGRARKAMSLGCVTHVAKRAKDILPQADLVVLAMPVDQILSCLKDVAVQVDDKTLVLDLGSAKATILTEADRHFKAGNLVGCHPMAGSEKHGPQKSGDNLFFQKKIFVVPGQSSSPKNIKKAMALWRSLGARPQQVSAGEHDRVMALVSHFPQLVASTLVAAFDGKGLKDVFKNHAGQGWRDTTRIAASDAKMWTAIFKQNQKNILTCLKTFSTQLGRMEKAIVQSDWRVVAREIKRAASFKKSLN